MKMWMHQNAICGVAPSIAYHCQSLCRYQDLRNDSKPWRLLSAAAPHVFTCGLQVCTSEDTSTRPGIPHNCSWECFGTLWIWCAGTKLPAETHQAQWGTTFARALGMYTGHWGKHQRIPSATGYLAAISLCIEMGSTPRAHEWKSHIGIIHRKLGSFCPQTCSVV